MSIIVFTGILADIPLALARTFAFIIIVIAVLMVVIVWGIVFVESAERKIPRYFSLRRFYKNNTPHNHYH